MSTKNLEYYFKLDPLAPSNHLVDRHIGPSVSERVKMLHEIGVSSLDELIKKTLPENLPRNNLPEWEPKTEQEILATLHRVATGRTSLSIAHRLSTIADADTILVLDQGRLAESGTHTDLLRRDGLYADMWSRQAAESSDLEEAAE